MKTITPLKAFLLAATAAEKKLLAQGAGTSVQYLAHLGVNDDRAYKREPRPGLAALIERETKVLSKASKGRLPIVWRTDLVTACRECEFAKRCLGEIAERSEFPVVVSTGGAKP